MRLLKEIYKKKMGKPAPYYYDYSLLTIISKPIRKFVSQVIAPNCPFNNLRVKIYRLCGFKIGMGTFIGMKCYLDDMCYYLIEIGNHVTISYGVYFACHGKNQGHYPIEIKDGAYIGMRSSILSKNCMKDTAGGGIDWQECNCWRLHPGEQRYSGWCDSGWDSLQNYRKSTRRINSCPESGVAA